MLVIVRPGVALAWLEAATAWARAHEHVVIVTGLVLIGAYLVVKGAVNLLD